MLTTTALMLSSIAPIFAPIERATSTYGIYRAEIIVAPVYQHTTVTLFEQSVVAASWAIRVSAVECLPNQRLRLKPIHKLVAAGYRPANFGGRASFKQHVALVAIGPCEFYLCVSGNTLLGQPLATVVLELPEVWSDGSSYGTQFNVTGHGQWTITPHDDDDWEIEVTLDRGLPASHLPEGGKIRLVTCRGLTDIAVVGPNAKDVFRNLRMLSFRSNPDGVLYGVVRGRTYGSVFIRRFTPGDEVGRELPIDVPSERLGVKVRDVYEEGNKVVVVYSTGRRISARVYHRNPDGTLLQYCPNTTSPPAADRLQVNEGTDLGDGDEVRIEFVEGHPRVVVTDRQMDTQLDFAPSSLAAGAIQWKFVGGKGLPPQ
jgi:hypothetical protein